MTQALRIRIVQSIADIPAAAWDACAADVACETASPPELGTRAQAANPFVSHAFLLALEQARTGGGRPGWQPRHLLVETAEGEIPGPPPCYVKSHSKGEYVFDHG